MLHDNASKQSIHFTPAALGLSCWTRCAAELLQTNCCRRAKGCRLPCCASSASWRPSHRCEPARAGRPQPPCCFFSQLDPQWRMILGHSHCHLCGRCRSEALRLQLCRKSGGGTTARGRRLWLQQITVSAGSAAIVLRWAAALAGCGRAAGVAVAATSSSAPGRLHTV